MEVEKVTANNDSKRKRSEDYGGINRLVVVIAAPMITEAELVVCQAALRCFIGDSLWKAVLKIGKLKNKRCKVVIQRKFDKQNETY